MICRSLQDLAMVSPSSVRKSERYGSLVTSPSFFRRVMTLLTVVWETPMRWDRSVTRASPFAAMRSAINST